MHVAQELPVVNMHRGAGDRMNQFRPTVDANVRRHTNVPLIAFVRLMHLWVSPLILVLGRTQRIYDRGFHDGPTVNPPVSPRTAYRDLDRIVPGCSVRTHPNESRHQEHPFLQSRMVLLP